MLQLFASEYRIIVQDILSFALIIAAFAWGGGPERAVAATWLVAFEIAGRLRNYFVGETRQLLEIDPFLAGSDLVAGICWIGIALYANRNYTLWIAGLQILAMAAHVARGLTDAITPLAYIVMVVAPGWFQLILLGIGISRHIMRKRKFGEYRDWRIIRRPENFVTPFEAVKPQAPLFGDAPTTWRDDVK